MAENVDIIELLKSTYCFYRQKYVVMKKEYTKTVGHYFTDRVLQSHLDGQYAVGVFAGPKVTRFLSVDIDAGGKHAVRQTMAAFETLGIPHDRMYVSTSGKKGYHVDIFFEPWIYNEKARNLYELMIWQTGLDPKKVELRPTATQAIKLPLGIHAATGRRCWFLDRDTLEPIESLAYIAQITPIDGAAVADILRKWNKKRWNELYADMICQDAGHDESIEKEITFDDAYYEGKRITECGTRHQVMVEIACDLRHYGANASQIGKALRGFYYRQDMLYMESSEEEVREDIREIAQWAEDAVPVWKFRDSPGKGNVKSVTFDKYDAKSILMAPTSATRKVALLLYAYCKMFGAAHISCETIADTVGCAVATVETAVGKLVENKIINRQSGGCHYAHGRLVRKSNTYFIPKDRAFGCPDASQIIAESYTTSEKIGAENFSSYYYRVLASLCTDEYLAQFLSKSEMSRVWETRRLFDNI